MRTMTRRGFVRGMAAGVAAGVVASLAACGTRERAAEQPATREAAEDAAEKLRALSPEETVRRAIAEEGLTITDVYAYAPYDGALSCLAPDEEARASRVAPVPTRVYASPAFYPLAATVIGWHCDEASYRAGAGLASIATSAAFEQLAAGEDCVVLATMPNAEQRAMLDASGLELRYEPIARDALMFYGHPAGAEVGGWVLSQDALRGAYRDETDLQTVALRHGNGSTTCFESFVDGDTSELAVGSSCVVYPDMNSIIAGAALARPSLGYCYRQFWAWSCSSAQLDAVWVDGVEPSASEVVEGRYPLRYDVCVMFAEQSPSASAAEELVWWLRSEEGAHLLASLGLEPASEQR